MPSRPLPVVTPSVSFLRSVAVPELPPCSIERLEEIARQGFGPGPDRTPWHQLVADAERHGLASLLFRHLQTLAIDLPPEVRQQLLSLRIRHRRANAARARAVAAILDAFDALGLRAALLKGAALVDQIYPEPAMRPMSDIDILVDPAAARIAQRCLLDLGYRVADSSSGTLYDHHHLPMAITEIDGVAIRVEVHRDALSGDVDASLTMDSLSEPLRSIALPDRKALALGHIDMLRHLCHHTFEPVAEIKLGAIVDLYGYACHHIEELDTARIDRRYPFVRNIFRLLGAVSPLPTALHPWVRPGDVTEPRGAGFGYPPMTETLSKDGRVYSRIPRLFSAPDWWLHGFYNVAPGQSIVFTRYLRHPFQVTRWLGRRATATVRHRLAGSRNGSDDHHQPRG